MSCTETHIGKIIKVDFPDGVESWKERLDHLMLHGLRIKDYDYNIEDKYICRDSGYVSIFEDFYKLVDHKKDKDGVEEISEATRNADGSISFILQYYNGGCCLEESLENAMTNIKEAIESPLSEAVKPLLDAFKDFDDFPEDASDFKDRAHAIWDTIDNIREIKEKSWS